MLEDYAVKTWNAKTSLGVTHVRAAKDTGKICTGVTV